MLFVWKAGEMLESLRLGRLQVGGFSHTRVSAVPCIKIIIFFANAMIAMGLPMLWLQQSDCYDAYNWDKSSARWSTIWFYVHIWWDLFLSFRLPSTFRFMRAGKTDVKVDALSTRYKPNMLMSSTFQYPNDHPPTTLECTRAYISAQEWDIWDL